MALKDGQFYRGALGALIFRVVRGKQRVSVREEPGTRKQTKATKAAGKRFGMASSLGAAIRETFEVNVGTIQDPTANERLTGVLIKVLKDCHDWKTNHFNFQEDSFERLKSFDWNINAKMHRTTSVNPQVSFSNGVIEVKFDEIDVAHDVKFPGNSFGCEILISMSLLRLRDGKVLGKAETESLKFNKANENFDAQSINFIVPDGCLCLIRMTQKFAIAGRSGWKVIGSKKYNPSAIVGTVVTPGKYRQDSRIDWREMIKFG